MSKQTYTPTHCPETGRKFTKAERKAANKARYAAERAAQTPKPKRKPIKGDIHSEQFWESQEPSLREAVEMVNGTAERHHTYGTDETAAEFEKAKATLREIEAAKDKPKAKTGWDSLPDHPTATPKAPKPAMTDEQRLMKMTKAQLVALIMFHDVPDPEPTNKPKRKKKPVKASKPAKATKAVKRPKRSSEAGLEQAQARTATAQRVGKVKKTKVVHAVTGKEAQPFEPRMEVPVEERKAPKREQMMLTLLPGETPEEGVRRMKIQAAKAELEATLLEAEQLTMNFEA